MGGNHDETLSMGADEGYETKGRDMIDYGKKRSRRKVDEEQHL